jgi:hypothetical protein
MGRELPDGACFGFVTDGGRGASFGSAIDQPKRQRGGLV